MVKNSIVIAYRDYKKDEYKLVKRSADVHEDGSVLVDDGRGKSFTLRNGFYLREDVFNNEWKVAMAEMIKKEMERRQDGVSTR